MNPVWNIALVAHDHKKEELMGWLSQHLHLLQHHNFYATGTTGRLIEERLGIPVHRLQSGPLGGDQQIGALMAEGKLDFLFFFWDPLSPLPHDPDIRALLRLAVVWNVPVACNIASADFFIHSTCFHEGYQRAVPDYSGYIHRNPTDYYAK